MIERRSLVKAFLGAAESGFGLQSRGNGLVAGKMLGVFLLLTAESAFASPETFFGIDSAASSLAQPGSFLTPSGEANLFGYVVDSIAKTGFVRARERLSWRLVNPRPGEWDFQRYLKAYGLYRDKGIGLTVTFHNAPDWMDKRGKLPVDLTSVYAFCRKLGETFGDLVESWEFWNEEDIGFCDASAWDYAAAAKAAYLGFKDARPTGLALMGGLSKPIRNAYDEMLFANDLGYYTDAFNLHVYGRLADYPKVFAGVWKFLEGHGLGDLAIWITESGTHQEGRAIQDGVMAGFKAHSPRQELLQAEIAAKSQFLMMMAGVSKDYFFCFPPYNEQQGGSKDWGVMRRDGTLKPVADVFAEMMTHVGMAEIVGEVVLAENVKAYAFRQPGGAFTLAYVARGKVDDGTEIGENDQTQSVQFRFDGRDLEASALPKYLDGLSEVSVEVPANPRGRLGARRTAPDGDSRVVLQLGTDESDFRLGGAKSTLEWTGGEGRVKVVVYNFDKCAKTGVVTSVGGRLLGLPATVCVPAWGKAEFDCRYQPKEDVFSEQVLLQGCFDGRTTSRLVLRVLNPTALGRSCTSETLPIEDEARWERNDSADTYETSWDAVGRTRHFHLTWQGKQDRWFYPRFLLKPGEMSGAQMLEFEVRSVQDKIENDFKSQYVMLFSDNGRRQFAFDAPIGSWEKRWVDLSSEKDLDQVRSLSVGANPHGRDISFWIRNVRLYRTRNLQSQSRERNTHE